MAIEFIRQGVQEELAAYRLLAGAVGAETFVVLVVGFFLSVAGIEAGDAVEVVAAVFAQGVAANVVGNQPVPAPETKEEKYLSRTEVMEIFGISYATLWRWSKDCPASQD